MSNGVVTPDEFIKDPESNLDYELDWADFIAEGDEISDSSWILGANNEDENDLTVGEDKTFGSNWTKCWLSGGIPGKTYFLTNRVETTLGRVVDRSVIIIILDQ